ncbi:MAG: YceI family protein [Bdellovibrionales bacterium]|nr:YceI family protein [Bdellovibrionales bacterium]
MSFKSVITALSVIGFSLSAWSGNLDTLKSEVTWTGSKVIGDSHVGNVKVKDGEVKYKNGEPTSANVVIDMTTITNNDLKDPKWNKKLVGHLNSDDFFSTNKYKTATLDAKSIKKASDKFYFVTGDLNIKGKSNPVKVKVEVVEDKKDYQVVKADLEFDRTKWGIQYNSGSFFSDLGDKMIADEVKLSVKLHVKKDVKKK